MTGFSFDAYVVKIIDGDTALVRPQIYPPHTNMVVRFKDVFAPEAGEEGGTEAADAARAMFPEGSRVTLTNTAIRWTFFRLEARVDPV